MPDLFRLGFTVLMLGLSVAACAQDTQPLLSGVPASHELITLERQAKRMTNQTHVFTSVPESLAGTLAVIPHRGPSTSEPGPGYTVTLERPAAVYLAVHKRGQPTIPEVWKPTGLTIGWGNHEDDVYVRIAQAGEVAVPEHDGKAGGFGVPHMLLASANLDQARTLIANPVARRSAIHRPARVIAVLADPNQPGLYGHPGDTIRFKLRVIPGTDGQFPETLTVEANQAEGAFAWSKDVTLDANGHTPVLSITPQDVGFYALSVNAEEGYDLSAFRGGVGIVPEPGPTSLDSPWGVMRVGTAPFEAKLARMLGVSWVRHSNWNMVTPLPDGGINPEPFRSIAQAYHDQGIHIMASISLVPPALSSKPGDTSQSGDAGPLHSRVRPADWEAWQQFMHDTAQATQGLIDFWEIGNEPNTPHHYWAGTVEEFSLLVKHSAQGIHEVNPDATILTAGFTLNPDAGPYFDRMLELGVGEFMDVLTVHSLYAKALSVEDMRALLKKHGLDPDMPVWSTEPKHVLAIRNFEAGIEKNMHFMLVNPGAYGAFQALAERDGAATKWGVAYAIASGRIAEANYVETVPTGLPDVELGRFESSGEQRLAANAEEGPRGAGIRVKLTPAPGMTPRYTDLLGNSLNVPVTGEFVMPLDRSGVLDRCARIEIVGVEVAPEATQAPGLEVTADKAILENGFVMRSGEDREHYAVVFKPAGPERPRITFPFTLEKAGTYTFYTSAMWFPSHSGNLVSPFSWSIDGKNPQRAPVQTSVHWRRSTRSHLRFGEILPPPTPDAGITTSQTLAMLGVVRNLEAGDHTLTIELQSPRQHDQHFSMEVELIAARPITDDGE